MALSLRLSCLLLLLQLLAVQAVRHGDELGLGEAIETGDEYRTARRCVDCGEPPAVSNGRVAEKAQILKVTYQCDEGYKLVPAGGEKVKTESEMMTMVMKCQGNGELTGQAPQCIKMCAMPTVPENGLVSFQADAAGQATLASQPLAGQDVFYSCAKGHSLFGTSKTSCLESGEYSSPPPICFHNVKITVDDINFKTEPIGNRLKVKIFDSSQNFHNKDKGYLAETKIPLPVDSNAKESSVLIPFGAALHSWVYLEMCKDKGFFRTTISKCQTMSTSYIVQASDGEECKECLGPLVKKTAMSGSPKEAVNAELSLVLTQSGSPIDVKLPVTLKLD